MSNESTCFSAHLHSCLCVVMHKIHTNSTCKTNIIFAILAIVLQTINIFYCLKTLAILIFIKASSKAKQTSNEQYLQQTVLTKTESRTFSNLLLWTLNGGIAFV